MKKFLLFCCICIFVVLIKSQNIQETNKTQKIEGIVTDFFGVPWEGVKLKLKSRGEIYKPLNDGKVAKIEKETKTDSNGKYSFSDLPDDSYEITLLRTDILSLEETKQTGIIFNGEPYKLDFGIEVAGVSECQFFVSGIVKDNYNKPMEGAKVSAFSAFNQKKVVFATTNKSGFYSINICSLGQYVVFINTPKYEVQTRSITLQFYEDYSKKIDFSLKPLSQQLLNWRK